MRQAGCYLKREGASHSLWVQPATGTVETVPRHQEIKELLAKKILRAYPQIKDWLFFPSRRAFLRRQMTT